MSLSRHIREKTSLQFTHWYKRWNYRRLIDIRVHLLLLPWTSQAPMTYRSWRCSCYDIRVIFNYINTSFTFRRRCKLWAFISDNTVCHWHLPPFDYWMLILHLILLSLFFQFNGPFLVWWIPLATLKLQIGGNMLLLDYGRFLLWKIFDEMCLLLIFVWSLSREVYFIRWICRDNYFSVNWNKHICDQIK